MINVQHDCVLNVHKGFVFDVHNDCVLQYHVDKGGINRAHSGHQRAHWNYDVQKLLTEHVML